MYTVEFHALLVINFAKRYDSGAAWSLNLMIVGCFRVATWSLPNKLSLVQNSLSAVISDIQKMQCYKRMSTRCRRFYGVQLKTAGYMREISTVDISENSAIGSLPHLKNFKNRQLDLLLRIVSTTNDDMSKSQIMDYYSIVQRHR